MLTFLSACLLSIAACASSIPPGYEQGATLRVYEIGLPLQAIPELVPDQTPNVDLLVDAINFQNAADFGGQAQRFFAEVIGSFWIETPGQYTFALTSDDGSRLTINGEQIIDNDGVHPPERVDGKVNLKAGAHPFKIEFFEHEGGEMLRLEWRPPGADQFSIVPTTALLTEAGVTRVVAPGYKRITGAAGVLRPGWGMPLDTVHPAFEVTTIRPEEFKPQVGGMTLSPGGTLYFTTFKPNQNGWQDGLRELPDGVVWRVKNPKAPRDEIVIERASSSSYYEPAGLAWMDGSLFLSTRNEITQLLDSNNDGSFNTRIRVAQGWISDNYHHFTFGLTPRNGKLYAALSTAIALDGQERQKYGYVGLNGPNPPNRGTLVEIEPKTGAVNHLAGGFRTPNGIGIGPNDEILVSDNQGSWNPSNSLYAVKPGRFYGHYNSTKKGVRYPEGGNPGPFEDQPVSPPAIILPQSEVANSPTTPAVIPTGPFAGQVYLGELTAGGIRRVFLEQVNGETQGAVFRFTQGLECGVNRLVVAPDGTIYIGGTGANGNWNWRGTTYGLQRLDPKPDADWPFEMHRIEAIPGGFRITMTEPANADQLSDPETYRVRQWYETPTEEYGGAKRELESIAVESVSVSQDGRSVELLMPDLRPGRVVHITLDLESATGDELWSNEAWYTLNQMPIAESHPDFASRVLVFSKTAGFRHGSIGAGVAAVQSLGDIHEFDVHATEDASYFNDSVLSRYDAVVFLNTTGDVLNDEQQASFERYIRSGGGFVGIHSATDTEYDWPWYGRLVGAYFKGHPPVQNATIHVIDCDHPSTAHLDETWQRRDEWYNFRDQPKGVRVLAELDGDSYNGNTMDPHPIVWCHEFDGGRAFYTVGGHTSESFAEPAFLQHLLGAIKWAMGGDVQP